MYDYQKGKIYKLVGGGLTYYGSTTVPLSRRKSNHHTGYKLWKSGNRRCVASSQIFDKCPYEEVDIVLVELYPCNTEEELRDRERYYIENNECVNNEVIPTRTKKEQETQWRLANKEAVKERAARWRLANKERLLEKEHQYRELNREKINSVQKKYRASHNQSLRERQKKYRELNSEKLRIEREKPYHCQCCDVVIKSAYKFRHNRSNAHLERAAMSSQYQPSEYNNIAE